MDLKINLTPELTDTGVVAVTLTEGLSSWEPGQRASSGLLLAAEWLQAAGSAPAPLPPFYDPRTFQTAGGQPISLVLEQDGLLRVVVAAVPVLSAAQLLSTAANTAYLTAEGFAYVRRPSLSQDPALNPLDLLGTGADPAPEVLGFTAAYYLSEQGLVNALARLNLRYLRLAYNQQHELVTLYERAALYQTGVRELARQGRYLDAAATLQAAQYLLSTQGQTPDEFGPVLGGSFPYTSA